MRDLIRHLIENNKEEIVKKSIMNCHVKGLHSVMLLDSPGKTIRMFVTGANNDMVRNYDNNNMSLGFHPHHCYLTLKVIKGQITNRILKCVPSGMGFTMQKHRYISKILNENEAKIEHIGEQENCLVVNSVLNYDHSIGMSANTIHTVGVGKGIAAWLVFEGKEDKNYQPLIYSGTKIEKLETEGLYQKPTEEEVDEMIRLALS